MSILTIFSMKVNHKFELFLFLVLLLPGLIRCTNDVQVEKGLELKEYTGFLKTPGIGFQTFFRFADEDLSFQSLPFSSGSAYFRWMWEEIEPQEGNYNWEFIDRHLERARDNGQTLEFRIMLEFPGAYEIGIPQWLVDKGVKLRKAHCENEDYYSPDLEDPVIKMHHEKLIRAVGNRYDGHPDLGSVDIGSVGLWGEWHEYCQPELMPDRAEREAIIDLYYESFPNTPLVALVDDKEAIAYAAAKGKSAWRGDCWGNYLPEGSGWNHHRDSYWPAHQLIPNAWENGPVALESCYTMKSWYSEGNAIEQIVNDAIVWHASLAHNKSDYIPEAFRKEVERLVMKLGFRLVLRKINYTDEIKSGSTVRISMEWENIGIAPPYRDHRIAFRLRDAAGQIQGVYISEQSIQGWLPGSVFVEILFALSADLDGGVYKLETGLVFHNAIDRLVPIAIDGRTKDGWYGVGNIELE
ncbi:MAG: DUF4832 domain-containing protein [Cyclobacteriaceae bacterium]|nr:DUF4832 domain-containing protein [Cyclobacteriaceae bacterium]